MAAFHHSKSAATWSQINSRGFPAISVPAGFTTHVFDRDADLNLVGPIPAVLPVGIDFLALPFDEPTLLKIAAAYEAATHHRTPPPDFGPLDEDGNPINAATPGEPREIPKEPKVKPKDQDEGQN